MNDRNGSPSLLIGISIVNYKTAALVERCLSSLAAVLSGELIYRVVVVDNDSGDGSYDAIRNFVNNNGMDTWVDVVAAERNGGYSYGNNIALKRLMSHRCQYYWLLNPDTRVFPGTAEKLVQRFASSINYAQNPVGIVGSRLQDDDGTVQVSAFNFPSPFGELINTCKIGFIERKFPRAVVPRPVSNAADSVDWVAGASLMLAADVIEKVGLMDEEYFLYFEEVDYCLAIKRAGYQIIYEPESKVFHQVGAATGISDTRKKASRRPRYWFESRQRFFQKNYGFAKTLVADLLWIIAFSSLRLRSFVQRKVLLTPPYFLWDFFRNSSWVKGRIKP